MTPKQNITIITSHINADFDAIGSMIAAQKIYPNSVIVFPGSHGETIRDFFLQSVVYLLNIAEPSKINMTRVRKLVIVDTRKKNRIGSMFLHLLSRNDVEIDIYDHHTRRKDDIKGTKDIYVNTGSTVTILTNIIRKENVSISPEEATIMCMGIYEDTGSFMFSSTTALDLEAAAFLLSMGANLKIISSVIVKELSPEQIVLLNDMIHSIKYHNINGLVISTTQISLDKYFPNLAFLVNKIMQMKHIEILFAIVLMDNKIHIIARSRKESVNVGRIMEFLGGGGHKSAATTMLKGKTLVQAEHLLIEVVRAKIKPKYSARNLMSFPAIIVGENTTCNKAKKHLIRYNINALVITEDGTNKTPIIGYITRQILEKAIFHGLGDVYVNEYLVAKFNFVKVDAKLEEIRAKIITNKQRILPVVDKNNQVTGVITRTNLLDVITRNNGKENVLIPKSYQGSTRTRTKFITNFIRERINKRYVKIMIEIGKIASKLGYNVYLVGGFVRDLFLRRKSKDIDLVVEGNGILLAEEYAKRHDVKICIHKKFFTATIVVYEEFKIDVASSRMEYYRFPASLPIVEMSSIKMDLFRRDFSINALAIQLNPENFGRLIDFFLGQKDMKDKVLRVMHNMSFVEDPTRVFRALRFEQRFGFKMGKLTSNLAKNAVKMGLFDRLSGQRFLNEFKLVIKENNPTSVIIRLFDYGLMKVIMSEQENRTSLKSILTLTKSVTDWQDLLFMEECYERWAVYFMVIMRNYNKKKSCLVCEKMGLSPNYKKMFCFTRFKAMKCLKFIEKNEKLLKSEVFNVLFNLETEIILYMMVMTKLIRVREQISHYQTKLRNVSLFISGKDLAHMGLKPGPQYGYILKKLLMAKLDGKIKSREEEFKLAKTMIV